MNYKQIKFITLAMAFGMFSAMFAANFQELSTSAQQMSNSGKHADAIPLWIKVIESPQCSGGQKVAAIRKVAWTYAWPLKNFDKAVETLLRYSKDAGLNNNDLVNLKVNAVDYLMRMNPQQKEKAIQLMEECITLDNLHAESIIGSRTTLAALIHNTDKARADKLFKEALDACANQNQFNRVRNHAAGVKREQKLPDEAAYYYNMIANDPQNDAKTKINALIQIANGYMPDTEKANQALQKIIERDDADIETKARIKLQMTDNILKPKEPDRAKAAEIFFAIAYDKNLLNYGLRLNAFDKGVQQLLQMYEPAEKVIAKFEKMYAVPLKGADKVRFIAGYGNYLIQNSQFEKAIKIYLDYAKSENTESAARQTDEWLGKLEAAMGNSEKSIQYFLSAANYIEVGNVLFDQKKYDEANTRILEGMEKQPENRSRLFGHMISKNPVDKLRELVQKDEIQKYLKEYPEFYNALGSKVSQAMEFGAYDYVAAIVPEYMKNQKEKVYPAQNLYFQINAEAMLGNKAKAAELIRQAAANPNILNVNIQFRFKIMEAALIDSKAESEKKIIEVINTFKTQFKDLKQIPEEMNKAGMTMVMLNARENAERIVKARENLYSSMPKKTAEIKFFQKDFPVSVEGWMAILPELRKQVTPQKLERQLWGANVEFMLATDMAIKRDVQGGKDASGISTEFFSVCDANAFYVFIMAYDNNVPAIAKGFANGGSYELYLATGELQPYYCSMININQDNTETIGFHSNYRNEYSLAPRVGKELKTETRVVAHNATATLLIYPWEQFYNTLPDSPGSTWQFDIMRWSGPGSSWSGTNSVHNRSTYGDLVFNLNEDQLTAIRRNILYKARKAYDKHKGSRWRGTGLYDFWQNPQLGDTAFYNDVLKPYQDKLEAAVAKITIDMDDKSVNELYLKYADKLFNLDFDVAKMRKEYLENQMFSDDTK